MGSTDYAVLGGGLAGLTMASEISRTGKSVIVVERARTVGGLARTVTHDGFSFDLGGHRFHSNNLDVVAWLHDLLGADLLRVTRRSRIHLNGRFIDYPIRLAQATGAFGFARGVSIAGSYAAALAANHKNEAVTFEDWVVRRFGRGLFDIYFKPYTEKVWGIPCDQLAADWAAQRIGLPSLTQAIYRALVPARTPAATAIPEFYYPRTGYGEICDRLAEEVAEAGNDVLVGATVERVAMDRESARVDVRTHDGATKTISCGHVISTIPIDALLRALSHDPDVARVAADSQLAYRGLLLIFLALDRPQVSTDTWTYFPDPSLLFGRCHEPKNWSAAMVPKPRMTSLALEVFCSQGDETWVSDDRQLVDVAVRQLEELSWIRRGEVRGAWVLREPCAYPVYSLRYREQMAQIRSCLSRWPRLSLLGRTGGFQYLNADGIIEEAFAMAASLGLSDSSSVRPLAVDAGRWV